MTTGELEAGVETHQCWLPRLRERWGIIIILREEKRMMDGRCGQDSALKKHPLHSSTEKLRQKIESVDIYIFIYIFLFYLTLKAKPI